MSTQYYLEHEFQSFAEAVRQRESGGNYEIVNSYGYMGAYQFGMARLCDLGYTIRTKSGWGASSFAWREGWTRDRFLTDHAEQDEAFRLHVRAWCYYVSKRPGLTRHIGKPLSDYSDDESGDALTLSGMIGVVHLLGPGGLSGLLKGDEGVDGYGTKASDYLKRFNGYF